MDKDIIISIGVALIMFGIGLNVRISAFKEVFQEPRAILAGLGFQIIGLPIIGFVVALIAPIDPVYKAGIVLITASPGGTGSNLVTHLLNGRVALSISLTSINSFLILFSIPFILDLTIPFFLDNSTEFELSFRKITMDLAGTILLPVGIGAIIRRRFPDFTDRLRAYLKYVLAIILLIVFSVAAFVPDDGGGSLNYNWSNVMTLLIPLVVLNLVATFGGYFAASGLSLDHDSRYTIAIEIGLQNSALAIFLASQVSEIPELVLAPVIYSGFSFFSTLLVAGWMKSRFGKQKLEIDLGK